jgi:uncharacterized protein (TIGR03067 family)
MLLVSGEVMLMRATVGVRRVIGNSLWPLTATKEKVCCFVSATIQFRLPNFLAREIQLQRIICVLVVLAAPRLLAADSDDDVRKELKALQGNWKAVAVEAGGKAFPKDAIPDFTFVISADGKSTGKMPQSEYSATITVNPTKDPKTIDNLHESGDQKGKKQYGIYKLEGDKLTVCMTPPGSAEADRPKDFTTKDTRNVVFIFERTRKEK